MADSGDRDERSRASITSESSRVVQSPLSDTYQLINYRARD